MRNISGSLEAHFAGEVTTLATCWLIIRLDDTVMGFTDHDRNIVFAGVTYESIAGFTPSAIESKSNMSVDNLDVEGQLSTGRITESDLLAGKYNFAEVEIFLVNYANLAHGKMVLKSGKLGEVTLSNKMFTAEIRGLTQHLSQTIGEVYSSTCRAILGDSRCKVNLAEVTAAATVTSVTSNQTFTATALTQLNGWFAGGEVAWTSGNNAGVRMEVKEFATGQVVLALPMGGSIAVGDEFNIITGCDKNSQTCIGKFGNIINFRGEPDVPGMDKLLITAGTMDRDSRDE